MFINSIANRINTNIDKAPNNATNETQAKVSFTSVIPFKVRVNGKLVDHLVKEGTIDENAGIKLIKSAIRQLRIKLNNSRSQFDELDRGYKNSNTGRIRNQINPEGISYLFTGKQEEVLERLGKEIGKAKGQVKKTFDALNTNIENPEQIKTFMTRISDYIKLKQFLVEHGADKSKIDQGAEAVIGKAIATICGETPEPTRKAAIRSLFEKSVADVDIAINKYFEAIKDMLNGDRASNIRIAKTFDSTKDAYGNDKLGLYIHVKEEGSLGKRNHKIILEDFAFVPREANKQTPQVVHQPAPVSKSAASHVTRTSPAPKQTVILAHHRHVPESRALGAD